ncbi:hypothetical protein C8R43DRAFT_905716 [Mycena crocata]|nr:hypothetical protein C8R43DRAFT_905716 [Mycena crocata]
MGQIIELIYSHCHGQPPTNSVERQQAFSYKIPHTDIRFACPSLSSWVLVLVGKEACKQAGNLTKDDPADPDNVTQLRASTNGRVENAETASWNKLTDNLSIPKVALKYEARAGVPWYLTEMMAGPSKGGAIVLWQRRPHTTIQVGAISSFVLSRNQ